MYSEDNWTSQFYAAILLPYRKVKRKERETIMDKFFGWIRFVVKVVGL